MPAKTSYTQREKILLEITRLQHEGYELKEIIPTADGKQIAKRIYSKNDHEETVDYSIGITPVKLIDYKEKYAKLYAEITTPEVLPWYLRAIHIGLHSGYIGAAIGAAIGSFVPGLGTVIGAATGGALGTLGGIVVGIVSPIFISIAAKFSDFNADNYLATLDEEDIDELRNQQNAKAWYRPSLSKAFSWDARFFMGSGGSAIIGSAIGTLIFPGLGTVIGAGIGALVGGMAAIVHAQLAKRFAPAAPKKVKIERHWYAESSYDAPWFARLFVGATAGSIIGATVGSVVPVIGTVIGGAVGSLIGAGITLASPAAFAAIRKVASGMRGIFSNKNYTKSQDQQQPDAERRWYKQSLLDMPWYARVLAGTMGGVVLGASIGSIVPVVGTAIGALIGIVIAATAAYLSPFVARAIEKGKLRAIEKEKSYKQPELEFSNSKETIANSHSIDMPWYFRLAMGASAGAAIGGALGTVVPVIGNAIGAAAGAIIGTVSAIVTPAMYALKRYLLPPKLSHQLPNLGETIPWYTRASVGALIGGAAGAAVGTIVPVVGTLIGGAFGTLIGATLAVVVPKLKALFVAEEIEIINNPPIQKIMENDTATHTSSYTQAHGSMRGNIAAIDVDYLPEPEPGNQKLSYRERAANSFNYATISLKNGVNSIWAAFDRPSTLTANTNSNEDFVPSKKVKQRTTVIDLFQDENNNQNSTTTIPTFINGNSSEGE